MRISETQKAAGIKLLDQAIRHDDPTQNLQQLITDRAKGDVRRELTIIVILESITGFHRIKTLSWDIMTQQIERVKHYGAAARPLSHKQLAIICCDVIALWTSGH